ncbi:MAG: PQQ-binding-like beta-propeller repeat protein [Anaerolineaceae bacterium]|nr:PQQ-binding-like beta-propeller repeat protein [Anaerolineaceae bacterium]
MKRLALTLALTVALVTGVLAEDWPQFRGAAGDGHSAEKRLLKSWPSGGPKRLWQKTVGQGYASVAVVGDRIYTSGIVDGKLAVSCLDAKAKGKVLWQTPIDGVAGGKYAGSRSTPTVDGDLLYVLSDLGKVVCLKTADGKEVWSKNILSTYGAKNLNWKVSESLIVDGDKLICSPGGRASMVALAKTTGEEIWATPAVDSLTGYATARIIDFGGLRQAIGYSSAHIFGVNVETGELLWKHAQQNKYKVNATSIAFYNGVIFSSCGYGWGSQGLKLSVKGKKASVRQVYTTKDLDDHFGGIVRVGKFVFGTASRGGLVAIDMGTGETKYTSKAVGKSSNIFADGRLYCQGHDGTIRLVNPANGNVVGSFKISPEQKRMLWAHPAISGGVLYIRNGATLLAYRIKGR